MPQLLSFPPEVLLRITKSLTSVKDVAKLSQTCKELCILIKLNDTAIANALEPFPPLSPAEASRVVREQLHYDSASENDEDMSRQTSTALSGFPALRSERTTADILSKEALLLARAQYYVTSTNNIHVVSGPDAGTRELLLEFLYTKRETQTSDFANCLEIRYRATQNVVDATKLLLVMSAKKINRVRPKNTSCKVHPQDCFLQHEQARLLSAWFFIKLYILSERLPPWVRLALDSELKQGDNSQVVLYESVFGTICHGLNPHVLQELKIGHPDPTLYGPKLGPYRLRHDWEDGWQAIMDHCREWRAQRADKGWEAEDPIGTFFDDCDPKWACTLP